MHRIFLFLFALSTVATTLAKADNVSDPYRWLENSQDPRTQEWLEVQKNRFESYIEANPSRDQIKADLKKFLKFTSYSFPKHLGDEYLFRKIEPSQDQAVLYIQKGLDGTPRVLIDPNELSVNYPVSLTHWVPSPDCTLLAYGLSENGSDWTTWKVLDIATGEDRSDHLEKIKFSGVVWTPDSNGFYYCQYGRKGAHSIYYHALGTSQESDKLIYDDPQNESMTYDLGLTSDGRYLGVSAHSGTSSPNSIFYFDLAADELKPTEIIPSDGSRYHFVSSRGSKFYFESNKNAPLWKLIEVDISQTPCSFQDIIPEGPFHLESVIAVGEYFVTCTLENVSNRIHIYDTSGNWLKDVPLPGLGVAGIYTDHDTAAETKFYFSFNNLVQPRTLYRYTISNDSLELYKQPELPFDPKDYTIRQITYASKDGTQVPMHIVHRKDLEIDGNSQVLLTGYGGYGIIEYPSYRASAMAWVQRGGIFALAHIRGGGELGDAWHQAARGSKRQNGFDDFIAAAEWLIAQGYTKPSKLAITGASNGGLLVAVCSNQRPDLFGAVVVKVGVLDMLRFHLFTAGRFWVYEYGNPNNPNDFAYLRTYSPYHNIQSGVQYPPTLIMTGDHDDRVVPLHSYKYTAALQEAQGGNGSILLRVEKNAGHGQGKPMSKVIEEIVDTYAFLYQELE